MYVETLPKPLALLNRLTDCESTRANKLAQPQSSRYLTSNELLEHPEYPYLTWDLQPAAKGKAAVGKGRGGPFHICYEIHGHGPLHLVVSRA